MPDPNRRRDGQTGKSRSRSPAKNEHHSHRTRSPHRRHHHRQRRSPRPEVPKELPYGSRQLTKRDYTVFRPMFALYLDIQKQKNLDDLDETEAKGRWKSFIGKWNRGELAEGWYEPATLQKAIASEEETYPARDNPQPPEIRGRPRPSMPPTRDERPQTGDTESSNDSDASVGPTLPGKERQVHSKRMGPSIPNMQDLELKRETDAEDNLARREALHHAHHAHRTQQKEALEELHPRPAPGTHERRLEKRAQNNTTRASFADAKAPGIMDEVPDAELLGAGAGEGGGLSDFRRQRQELERKKNEREIRREEILRARREEREERMEVYRRKEEGTMEMLRGLAKARFG